MATLAEERAYLVSVLGMAADDTTISFSQLQALARIPLEVRQLSPLFDDNGKLNTAGLNNVTDAQSGSALGLLNAMYPIIAGVYYTSPGSAVAGAYQSINNRLEYMPIVIGRACTLNTLRMKTSAVAGNVGTTVRMGLYSSVAGLPASLLYDSGAVAAATANVNVDVTGITLALLPNVYWLASAIQGAATTAPTVVGSSSHTFGQATTTDPGNATNQSYAQSGVTGAFPAAATPVASSLSHLRVLATFT